MFGGSSRQRNAGVELLDIVTANINRPSPFPAEFDLEPAPGATARTVRVNGLVSLTAPECAPA
jgi:hypothetical protein